MMQQEKKCNKMIANKKKITRSLAHETIF